MEPRRILEVIIAVCVFWLLFEFICYLLRPRYDVTFDLFWDKTGASYPENAHTGNILLVEHDKNYNVFRINELTSLGVAQSAMFGVNDLLIKEVQKLGFNYHTAKPIKIGEKTSFSVKYNPRAQYITLIAMIAPSPDWFVASRPIKLRRKKSNKPLVYPLYAYDAGVDLGSEFQTFPKQLRRDAVPISLITSGALFPPKKTDDIQWPWTSEASKVSNYQTEDLYNKLQPIALLTVE